METESLVSYIEKTGELWFCRTCGYNNRIRIRTLMHVEAMHVGSNGYNCPVCNKFCSSKNGLNVHVSRYHRK